MTTDDIDDRIARLQKEAEILSASHDATVRRYQEVAVANQNRFQQIKGAIQELEWLKTKLNGASP